eukprot:1824038-Prymnesium_polylepis.1
MASNAAQLGGGSNRSQTGQRVKKRASPPDADDHGPSGGGGRFAGWCTVGQRFDPPWYIFGMKGPRSKYKLHAAKISDGQSPGPTPPRPTNRRSFCCAAYVCEDTPVDVKG